MLDFASLMQVRQGLQNSNDQRHQQSATLYAQGRKLIQEAMQSPVDKAKLQQATDCFAKGIQSNYRNPANFLGMAFLFLLIGQPRQAIPYIKSALELNQSSELGEELLQQAQSGTLPKAATPKPSFIQLSQIDQSQAKIDFDDLYEATQAAVMLFLRQIMTDEVMGFSPTPNPQQLALLQTKLQLFQDNSTEFHKQVEILDKEIEVTAIRCSLTAIDKSLQRIMALSQLFQQFIEIEQDIKKHTDMTEVIIKESQTTEDPKDIEILDENLQVLLDHCDSVADRLDEIEAKRIDIASLRSPYKHYVEQLERFQDMLEETIDRLKST